LTPPKARGGSSKIAVATPSEKITPKALNWSVTRSPAATVPKAGETGTTTRSGVIVPA
jgi:hypothetical protein